MFAVHFISPDDSNNKTRSHWIGSVALLWAIGLVWRNVNNLEKCYYILVCEFKDILRIMWRHINIKIKPPYFYDSVRMFVAIINWSECFMGILHFGEVSCDSVRIAWKCRTGKCRTKVQGWNLTDWQCVLKFERQLNEGNCHKHLFNTACCDLAF